MKKIFILSGLIASVVIFANCSKNTGDVAANVLTALPLTAPSPATNISSPAKIALGKLLFWDPILSGTRQVACGTCHNATTGFTDNLDLSIGVNGQGSGPNRHFLANSFGAFTKRNCMTILNTAFNSIDINNVCEPSNAVMFFDNRSITLEAQSLEPIKTLEEMRGIGISQAAIIDSIVNRLKGNAQYLGLFSDAFQTADAVSAVNLGKAIAAYERSLIANNSPFDKYVRGDKTAMSDQQINGMRLFVSNGCNKCHSGSMFSDYQLHVLSVPDNPKNPTDAGSNGTYAFRTQSLRNLSLTAPYMHSGVFNSLDEVLAFYDRAGDHHSQNPHVPDQQLDPKLQHINNGDRNSIIQFLNALNDYGFDKTIPSKVPSGLPPGGL